MVSHIDSRTEDGVNYCMEMIYVNLSDDLSKACQDTPLVSSMVTFEPKMLLVDNDA